MDITMVDIFQQHHTFRIITGCNIAADHVIAGGYGDLRADCLNECQGGLADQNCAAVGCTRAFAQSRPPPTVSITAVYIAKHSLNVS